MMRTKRPSPVRSAARAERGLTLIELTLSIAMLVTLTIVLFGFLRTGMGLYRQGEGRRDVFERAQILLDRLARDLDEVAAPIREPGRAPRVRFVGDRDDSGTPRLRFVRTLGTESVDPVLRRSGTTPFPTGVVDLVDDMEEAARGKLRASEGLMEVVWLAAAPRPSRRNPEPEVRLLRGIRTPIGGRGSFFDENALARARAKSIERVEAGIAGTGADDRDDGAARSAVSRSQSAEEVELPPATLRPLTGGVLWLGLRYRAPGADGGPAEWSDLWDSTRGRTNAFDRYVSDASRTDSGDDILPDAVELTLVLEEPGAGRVFLTRKLSESTTRIEVNSTDLIDLRGDEGWIRIGNEWILAKVASGTRLQAMERGGRGTTAVAHDERVRVRAGARFRRTVPIPVGRGIWP